MVKTTTVLNFKILVAMVFILALLVSPSLVAAGPSLIVNIEDAYYADIDSDGFGDDVYARVYVAVDDVERYSLLYSIILTQPSGYFVSHSILIRTRETSLTLETVFYSSRGQIYPLAYLIVTLKWILM